MTITPTPTHEAVREHYAERARQADSCCGPSCNCSTDLYDQDLIADLPAEIAGFTLGCGDPITLAALQPGEIVLDLGSGGGLDCFLAARQVGEAGRVIGVDMTPEMLAKARANAVRLNAANVEFRQGYLEALPVADASVDVVISNCVINLSPDKPQVFREIFRVLKPGGRVAVSDIVTNGQLPASVQKSMAAWGACVAGALDMGDYTGGLAAAGFETPVVQPKSQTDQALAALPVGLPFSAVVTAFKPGGSGASAGAALSAAAALLPAEGAFVCAAPGGVETRQADVAELASRIIGLNSVGDGYELLLGGERAETRALAEAFIQAEAVCCSFLHFSLRDSDEGLVLGLSGQPAAPSSSGLVRLAI
jgi:arsenite methyltransferase